jgi:hypothetical protein
VAGVVGDGMIGAAFGTTTGGGEGGNGFVTTGAVGTVNVVTGPGAMPPGGAP